MARARRTQATASTSPTWLRLGVAAMAALGCAATGKIYLTLDEETITTDGYANQVAFVLDLAESGGDWTQLDPLTWIHALRTAVALLFQTVEAIGGAPASAVLVLVLMWPILDLFRGSRREYLGLLLPCTMLILSYRSILVFVSIGYLLLFMVRHRSGWFLAAAVLLANLSSGAVMTSLLIALLLGRAYRPRSWSLAAYVATLVVSLAISAIDKYMGFVAGESGYDATVEGATGIMAIISRGTIFVSLLTGDYLRGIVYLGLLVAAVYGFMHASSKRLLRGYTVVFLTGVPAFLLEGLGVMSLLVPVLMFMAGVALPRRPLPATGFGPPARLPRRKRRRLLPQPPQEGLPA